MSQPCDHQDFAINATVNRLTDIGAFSMDISVQCADCNERFVFVGLPTGWSPNEAMMGPLGREARLPIRPASDAYRDIHGPSFGIRGVE